MRQLVILVSKTLDGDGSRINYSTIAKIFNSNVNSIKLHINSSIVLYNFLGPFSTIRKVHSTT